VTVTEQFFETNMKNHWSRMTDTQLQFLETNKKNHWSRVTVAQQFLETNKKNHWTGPE
jgi:hypothetical protein